jgi:hypothetical protein
MIFSAHTSNEPGIFFGIAGLWKGYKNRSRSICKGYCPVRILPFADLNRAALASMKSGHQPRLLD